MQVYGYDLSIRVDEKYRPDQERSVLISRAKQQGKWKLRHINAPKNMYINEFSHYTNYFLHPRD